MEAKVVCLKCGGTDDHNERTGSAIEAYCGPCWYKLKQENERLLEALMDTVNQATRQGGIEDYVLDPMALSAYEDTLSLLEELGKVELIPPKNYQYR